MKTNLHFLFFVHKTISHPRVLTPQYRITDYYESFLCFSYFCLNILAISNILSSGADKTIHLTYLMITGIYIMSR